MRVALLTTFPASRKEPLATMLERIRAAFLAAFGWEPSVRFLFSDSPAPGSVSSVERVLKRHPQLQGFVSSAAMLPGNPAVRQISNGPNSPVPGEPAEFSLLLAVAKGVPRSFPFYQVSVHFNNPVFGEMPGGGPSGSAVPGVLVGDSWWVNGRSRSLTALTIVDADPAGKKLPSPPTPVEVVLAACGKAKTTVQVPFLETVDPAQGAERAGPTPEVSQAINAAERDYRARLGKVVDAARLPHDLPPPLEAMKATDLGETTGPKKPVLVRAFGPLGYDCRGGSGTFTLRRRTPANSTVEVYLDVGTWSRSLTAGFRVYGLGFVARLPLPVSSRAIGSGQYPIGDAGRWQQIVENLAALVAELDRSFVPEIEGLSGPSPDWYRPES